MNKILIQLVFIIFLSISCNKQPEKKMEQLTLDEVETENEFDSLKYSLNKNTSFKQLTTASNSVVLTGIDRIRLLTIYKVRPKSDKNIVYDEGTTYSNDYDEKDKGGRMWLI